MRLSIKEVRISVVVLLNLLIIVTLIEPLETAVFILTLNAFAIILVRTIYNKFQYITIDYVILSIITLFHPPALIVFIPYLFICLSKKILIPLYLFSALLLIFFDSIILLILAFLSCMFALIVFLWEKEHVDARLEENRLRKGVYQLETMLANLLSDQAYTHHHAALQERMRIAEKLHDDLGHALTAAKLALDAYELTKETNSDQADKALSVVKDKIKESTTKLKQTVSQVAPEEHYGKDAFIKRINAIELKNVKTSITDNTNALSIMHWQLLESILKEAITNIYKHANPSAVHIDLTVTKTIVKLTIKNDGVNNPNVNHLGYGLQYMRKRLEALRGTLTIQRGLTFTLITVIPLRKED